MTSVVAARRVARATARTSGSLRSLFLLGGGGGGASTSGLVGEGPGNIFHPFSFTASFDGFVAASSSARLLDAASSAGGAIDVASCPRGDACRGHESWEGGSGQPSPHTPPAAWWCGGGGCGHPSRKYESPPPSPFFSATHRSSSSTSCAPPPRVVRALPPPRLPFEGISNSEWWACLMSSGATPPPPVGRGGSRFVRDESGRLVRSNGGGRGGGREGGGGRDGGRGGGGRRGGGGGRGRGRGGGGGGKDSPLVISSKLKNASCSEDILSIVKDNPRALNYIHVSMVFTYLGRMAKSPDFSPRRSLATDETFHQLLRRVL